PEVGKDLLDKADELGNFLQQQLRADGSIAMIDSAEEVENFSGPTLLGIARSHHLRPAAGKLYALHNALVHYHGCWRARKNMAMIAEHTAALTDAFLLTRERAFADFVFEMNDWLITHQYQNMETARQSWSGGFRPWADGKAVVMPPDIRSAAAAQSL